MLARFITPVVLVLVAITGTLVDGLELPVLQGGGLWVFYTVSGAMFVVSAAQLFLPAARGATTIRRSTRFLLLVASILLMLQVWALSIITAAIVSIAIPKELSREPSASNEGQAPGRRYRSVLSWFGLLLTVTIVVYLAQQEYQDRIHWQQLKQELAQERAAVVGIKRLDATKTTEAGVVELQKALPNCKITR